MRYVYVIRCSDYNAHEGYDGLDGIYSSEEEATKLASFWNNSPRRHDSFHWYVERWEVK